MQDIISEGQVADEKGNMVRAELLTHSEEELNDACQPLQEAAATEMSGFDAGLLLRLRAWWKLSDCHQKVEEIEERLASR